MLTVPTVTPLEPKPRRSGAITCACEAKRSICAAHIEWSSGKRVHQHQRQSGAAHQHVQIDSPHAQAFHGESFCSAAGSLLRNSVQLVGDHLRIGNQPAGFGLGFDRG